MKVNYFNQTNDNMEEATKIIDHIFSFIIQEKTMQVIFVSKEEILQINNYYRKINKITDVISFPSDENESLGDIFICLDKAIEQATEYGHSNEREIGFLAVHGYLHLIGYDHHTIEDEQLMIKKQKEILNQAKIKRGI